MSDASMTTAEVLEAMFRERARLRQGQLSSRSAA